MRKHMFSVFGRDCQCCKTPGGIKHVHHMVYRQPFESVIPADLMILCVPCHDVLHLWVRKKRLRLPCTRDLTIREIEIARKSPAVVNRYQKLQKRIERRNKRLQPKVRRLPSQERKDSKKLFKKFSMMRSTGFLPDHVSEFLRTMKGFLQSGKFTYTDSQILDAMGLK